MESNKIIHFSKVKCNARNANKKIQIQIYLANITKQKRSIVFIVSCSKRNPPNLQDNQKNPTIQIKNNKQTLRKTNSLTHTSTAIETKSSSTAILSV